MKASNLPHREFKVMVIRMLEELRNTTALKIIENMKKNQLEMKNTISDISNTLEEAVAGVAQLVGVLLCKLKGHGFDSCSCHMPRLQVWTPFRVQCSLSH